MSTYDELSNELDRLTEELGDDADMLSEVSRLVERLADDHDVMVNERDARTEDLDDLNKTARDAGYVDAWEALDVLSRATEHNLRAVVEDHHDSVGHRGPLRFCSDILCASVVAA